MAVVRSPPKKIYGQAAPRYSGGGGGSYVPPAVATLTQPLASSLDQPAGTLSATEARTGVVYSSVSERKAATVTGAVANTAYQQAALASRTQPAGIGRVTTLPSKPTTAGAVGLGAGVGPTRAGGDVMSSSPYYEEPRPQPSPREVKGVQRYYWTMTTPEQATAYREYRSYKAPTQTQETPSAVPYSERETALKEKIKATYGGTGIVSTIRAETKGLELSPEEYATWTAMSFKESREAIRQKGVADAEARVLREKREKYDWFGSRTGAQEERRTQIRTGGERFWKGVTDKNVKEAVTGLGQYSKAGISYLGTGLIGEFPIMAFAPQEKRVEVIATPRKQYEGTIMGAGGGVKEVPSMWLREPAITKSEAQQRLGPQPYMTYSPTEKGVEQQKKYEVMVKEKTGFTKQELQEITDIGGFKLVGATTIAGTSIASALGAIPMATTPLFNISPKVMGVISGAASGALSGGLGASIVAPRIKESISRDEPIFVGATIGVGEWLTFELAGRGPSALERWSPVRATSFETPVGTWRGLSVEGFGRAQPVVGAVGLSPVLGSPAKKLASRLETAGRLEVAKGIMGGVSDVEKATYVSNPLQTLTGKKIVKDVFGTTGKTGEALKTELEWARVKTLVKEARPFTEAEMRARMKETKGMGEENVRRSIEKDIENRGLGYGSHVFEAQLPEGRLGRWRKSFEEGKPLPPEGPDFKGAKFEGPVSQDVEVVFGGYLKDVRKIGRGEFSGVKVEKGREFRFDEESIQMTSRLTQPTKTEWKPAKEWKSAWENLEVESQKTIPTKAFGMRLGEDVIRAKETFKGKPSWVVGVKEGLLNTELARLGVSWSPQAGFKLGPEGKNVKQIASALVGEYTFAERVKSPKLRDTLQKDIVERYKSEVGVYGGRKVTVKEKSPLPSPRVSRSVGVSGSLGLSAGLSKSINSLSKSIKSASMVSPSLKSPSLKSPSLKSPSIKSVSIISPSLKSMSIKSPSMKSPSLKSPTFQQIRGGWLFPPIRLPKPYLREGRGRKGRGVVVRKGYTASLLGILSGRTIKRAPKGEIAGYDIRFPLSIKSMKTRFNQLRKRGLL